MDPRTAVSTHYISRINFANLLADLKDKAHIENLCRCRLTTGEPPVLARANTPGSSMGNPRYFESTHLFRRPT
jgi:hypothetical protein